MFAGDRQNDLKDERRRAQMAAARQVLERSTMMLLTSSKTCMRHPDCIDSRENRDTVFCQMRRAMDLIHYVVKDGVTNDHHRSTSRGQPMDWETERATASSSLRVFSLLVEHSRPRFESPPLTQMAISQQSSSSNTTTNGGGSAVGGCANNMSASSVPQKLVNANDISNSNRDCAGAAGLGEIGGLNGRPKELLTRSNSHRDRHTYQNGNGSGNPHKSRNYLSLDREVQAYTSKNDALNTEMSILSPQRREELMAALDKVVEKTQDFTDSAYTTHEHRENILLLCDRARLELNQCLRIAVNMEQFPNSSFDIDAAVDSVQAAAGDLSNQLCMAVADQTAELSHVITIGIDLVNSLRSIALNQELDRLQESADRFHDYIDHILDVSTEASHGLFELFIRLQILLCF